MRPSPTGAAILAFVQDPGQQWPQPPVTAHRRAADESESRSANGADWDRYADEYQATHGEFLGDAGFLWGPEGLTEAEAGVLGDVAGRDVLEVGSGAGQCSRWVRSQGGRSFGLDLSYRQLQHSRRIDEMTGIVVPSVLGTATHLPFADDSFDVVFSSFGALQFVADIDTAVRETARVLRPGGRFAFSITHPTRWMFPDDPGEDGLTATQSYWDRTPYVEVDDETGTTSYVEHHRTLGDWVHLLSSHRFHLTTLLEPEWPEDHDRLWGGWSRVRGTLTPGTALFGADLLDPPPASAGTRPAVAPR
ncbi:class I SAM-dependent methyltransferase [Nocardioides sp. zg-536]|uniref:Class I SAM-dependent methyltransferase n=1 Tax=Nocardioides faecalis TaxID=2803858 RepID=A0A938Y1P7_9ACTN|nr:class I SAM-dependent methyltransferase [Nocardioides faecalis]QVI57521.1 class I SAM-dependent methyltransferase [Nocardioides faecalis]